MCCVSNAHTQTSQDLSLLRPTLRVEVLGIPQKRILNRNIQTDETLIWPEASLTVVLEYRTLG